MPCGTLSANRAIFSEEKTVRLLLVGENPKSPRNAPLVRLRILRTLSFHRHKYGGSVPPEAGSKKHPGKGTDDKE